MTQAPQERESGSSGPMASGESPDPAGAEGRRDLQLVELDILREFVELCTAHGLRYYLAYGTLLGAVRHRGFIPWDDDIDVTMPREDYTRFAEICSFGLRPGLQWQSYATEKNHPLWFGKLIKTDTVLRQARAEHLAIQQSVFIDVFPLDGLADRPLETLLQRMVILIARMRLGIELKRRPLTGLVVQMTRILPRRSVIAMIEVMIRRYPAATSKRWICAGGPYGHGRQSFPSAWFGSGATQAFEDLTVVGPAEWDRYLCQLYGDYMTPPPPQHRVSHHEVTEVRLGPGRPQETSTLRTIGLPARIGHEREPE